MKKVLLIVLIIVVVIASGGFIAFSSINSNLKELSNTVISDVDLSEIPDGSYLGSYSVFPVSVEVRVLIKDHTITDIELIKHQNGKGSAAEVIPDMVVEAGSLEVDVISGATYSSKVILKAIENALT